MSTSNWQNISDTITIIRKVNPQSILDVGVGFGKWGFLCREYLEVFGGGRYKKSLWKIKIDGVEAFKKYKNPIYNYLYDQIYYQDFYKIIDKIGKYDLVIIGDVLEHFSKDRGMEILKKLKSKSKNILLNIPLGRNWKQGVVNDNKYEVHASFWELDEFEQFDPQEILKYRDYINRPFATILF